MYKQKVKVKGESVQKNRVNTTDGQTDAYTARSTFNATAAMGRLIMV